MAVDCYLNDVRPVRARMNVHFNKIIDVPDSCSFFHCIRIAYIDK